MRSQTSIAMKTTDTTMMKRIAATTPTAITADTEIEKQTNTIISSICNEQKFKSLADHRATSVLFSRTTSSFGMKIQW